MVVETMRKEGLSYRETEWQFDLPHNRASIWERIYLKESPEGFAVERRGKANISRPRKLFKEVEEYLIAENQRLHAEVACLKNLQALFLESARRQQKKRW